MDGPARVRETHHEHRELGQHSIQPDADPAEVDLGLRPGRMLLGYRHGDPAGLQFAPHAGHVGAHRGLRHLSAALVHQPLPDAPRRVTLLARRAQLVQ